MAYTIIHKNQLQPQVRRIGSHVDSLERIRGAVNGSAVPETSGRLRRLWSLAFDE